MKNPAMSTFAETTLTFSPHRRVISGSRSSYPRLSVCWHKIFDLRLYGTIFLDFDSTIDNIREVPEPSLLFNKMCILLWIFITRFSTRNKSQRGMNTLVAFITAWKSARPGNLYHPYKNIHILQHGYTFNVLNLSTMYIIDEIILRLFL